MFLLFVVVVVVVVVIVLSLAVVVLGLVVFVINVVGPRNLTLQSGQNQISKGISHN